MPGPSTPSCTPAFVAALAAAIATATPGRAAEGRGYAELEGQLGIPSGSLAPALPPLALGWHVSFGAGFKGTPFMLGLGAGVLTLKRTTQDGPTTLATTSDGFTIGPSDLAHTIELRQAELILRVQPEWRTIRPFADASVGLAAFWHTASVTTASDDVDASVEHQQDLTFAYGFALGVDIAPWGQRWTPSGSYALAVTLGLRSTYSGAIDYVSVVGNSTGRAPASQPILADLHELAPFVAVTLSFASGT